MEDRKEQVIELIYKYIDYNEGGGYLLDHDELYKELSILMDISGVLAYVSERWIVSDWAKKTVSDLIDEANDDHFQYVVDPIRDKKVEHGTK